MEFDTHLHSNMYFSLFFMLLNIAPNTHSSALPCLFIHAAHCEVGVRNKRAGRLGHSLVGEGPICLLTCLHRDLTPALRAHKQLEKGLTEHRMLNLSDKSVMRVSAVPGCFYCCFFHQTLTPKHWCPTVPVH